MVWDGFFLLRSGWGLDRHGIEKVDMSCECGLQVKLHHGKMATLDLDAIAKEFLEHWQLDAGLGPEPWIRLYRWLSHDVLLGLLSDSPAIWIVD